MQQAVTNIGPYKVMVNKDQIEKTAHWKIYPWVQAKMRDGRDWPNRVEVEFPTMLSGDLFIRKLQVGKLTWSKNWLQ